MIEEGNLKKFGNPFKIKTTSLQVRNTFPKYFSCTIYEQQIHETRHKLWSAAKKRMFEKSFDFSLHIIHISNCIFHSTFHFCFMHNVEISIIPSWKLKMNSKYWCNKYLDWRKISSPLVLNQKYSWLVKLIKSWWHLDHFFNILSSLIRFKAAKK